MLLPMGGYRAGSGVAPERWATAPDRDETRPLRSRWPRSFLPHGRDQDMSCAPVRSEQACARGGGGGDRRARSSIPRHGTFSRIAARRGSASAARDWFVPRIRQVDDATDAAPAPPMSQALASYGQIRARAAISSGPGRRPAPAGQPRFPDLLPMPRAAEQASTPLGLKKSAEDAGSAGSRQETERPLRGAWSRLFHVPNWALRAFHVETSAGVSISCHAMPVTEIMSTDCRRASRSITA